MTAVTSRPHTLPPAAALVPTTPLRAPSAMPQVEPTTRVEAPPLRTQYSPTNPASAEWAVVTSMLRVGHTERPPAQRDGCTPSLALVLRTYLGAR